MNYYSRELDRADLDKPSQSFGFLIIGNSLSCQNCFSYFHRSLSLASIGLLLSLSLMWIDALWRKYSRLFGRSIIANLQICSISFLFGAGTASIVAHPIPETTMQDEYRIAHRKTFRYTGTLSSSRSSLIAHSNWFFFPSCFPWRKPYFSVFDCTKNCTCDISSDRIIAPLVGIALSIERYSSIITTSLGT